MAERAFRQPPRTRTHPTPRIRDRPQGARAQASRACIGLLAALLLASVAHAVTDGLTPGLVLGLALTTLLLLASLRLWRVGSRREPDDTKPPGIEH